MFKNYLKTALRNFLRHRSNSVINIAGLMIGFAAFLLIFLVIKYEESFDDFHSDTNNIYRVVRNGKNINVQGIQSRCSISCNTEFAHGGASAEKCSGHLLWVQCTG